MDERPSTLQSVAASDALHRLGTTGRRRRAILLLLFVVGLFVLATLIGALAFTTTEGVALPLPSIDRDL